MNNAYFMSFVLAAALPAMAAEEQYDPLFKGVKDGALVSNDGGTWTTESATITATNDNTAVSFETADGSPIKLDVTATPADTNTIAKVELQVTLADVGDFMNDLPQGAQVAFCVCTNSFNAWNGSTWVALNEVPAEVDDSQTTNLTVEISYQGASDNVKRTRAARFTVGDTTLVTRDGGLEWISLVGASVASKENLAGFGMNGEGIIAQADAEVMRGIAAYDGIKYGTISNAVAEATKGTEDTPVVAVLRETDEDITPYLSGGGAVHIDAAEDVAVTVSPEAPAEPAEGVSEGASGEYTAMVNTTVLNKITDDSNIKITLPALMSETKEVDPNVARKVNKETGAVTFVVRTASSVLEAASPEDKPLTANIEKLHTFLANNAATAYTGAYESASDAASAIETALETPGANTLPLYQSYALGINSTDSVKPVTVASDTDPDAITLSIPSLDASTPSGDYTKIKYVMTKPDSSTVQFDKGEQIQVPLSTGSYQVKIVME